MTASSIEKYWPMHARGPAPNGIADRNPRLPSSGLSLDAGGTYALNARPHWVMTQSSAGISALVSFATTSQNGR